MQTKTKRRVLGLSAFVGLILVVLIFMQTGKETIGEGSVVKAPPFPEPTSQVLPEAKFEDNIIPNVMADSELKENSVNTTGEPAVPDLGEANQESVNPMNIRPSVINETTVLKSSEQKPSQDETTNPKLSFISDPASETAKNKSKPKKVKKILASKKSEPAQNNISIPLEDDGLFKLKNAAWVIQLGSFKNKNNALKLVNQLRAKGFKAFIQQVSTNLGESTRVFVGPETKHSVARNVAGQLENEMHLHGIVISYKPLTL